MTNLDNLLKIRDIALPTSVCYSQSYDFSSTYVWIRELERELSAKELMLLNYGVGEDLRAPWTARRSNQSILKEINPEYLLEGLM